MYSWSIWGALSKAPIGLSLDLRLDEQIPSRET